MRPKPEQVCERYKSKAATGVWRFWDRVNGVVFGRSRGGLDERKDKELCFIRKVN